MEIKTLIGMRFERKNYVDSNLKLEDAPICENPKQYCICKGFDANGPVKCLYKDRKKGCMLEINH